MLSANHGSPANLAGDPSLVRDIPRVVLTDLRKSYGMVHAVKSTSLQLDPGCVTAIVGENGAGKSTLVKMLAGVETPDAGSITIRGRSVTFRSARDAATAGIGMVFQETALVDRLTVWENIALGWETSSLLGLDKQACLDRLTRISDDFGLHVPANRTVGTLPVSVQQQVEILKVLYRDAQVVILDEPTGVLTPQEARGLFRAIRTLRDAGKSVVFISHKLNEVLDIADLIHVMRAGEIVTSTEPGEMEPRDLAKLMLGGELPVVKRTPTTLTDHPVVLSTSDLVCKRHGSSTKSIGPISLELRAGSVLGIAGVAGSGQDEFIATLTGLQPMLRGTVTVRGSSEVTVGPETAAYRSVRALRDAGLAYVPSNRGQVATLPTQPLWFSAMAGRQWGPRFNKNGFVRKRAARKFARQVIEDGAVKCSGIDALPASLSGGNLQKFIVARELASHLAVLIAEEPTRGIDVGSAVAIRQRARDLAANGCAVIVSSSDLDELMEVSDRVAVFFDGAMVAEIDRADATVEAIGAAMTGLNKEAGE